MISTQNNITYVRTHTMSFPNFFPDIVKNPLLSIPIVNKTVSNHKRKDSPSRDEHESKRVKSALLGEQGEITKLCDARNELYESFQRSKQHLEQMATYAKERQEQEDLLKEVKSIIEADMETLSHMEERQSSLMADIAALEKEKAAYLNEKKEWEIMVNRVCLAFDLKRK